MKEFRNYKKFRSSEDAAPFTDLLSLNSIPFKITETKPAVDVTFTGNMPVQFWLQLLEEDFEKVDELIEKEMFEGAIDPDHYLNEFTDSELIEIFEKFDEWSMSDYVLAKQLLKERGKDFSEEEIQAMKDKRMAELEKPEVVKKSWIIAGYITALFGGFIAIIIGVSFASTKKTLPDGRKVFSYDEKSRYHAKNFLFLGIAFLLLFLIYRIASM